MKRSALVIWLQRKYCLNQDQKVFLLPHDQIAFGVIKRLNEMRVKIPQEIAVIGYDNVPFSSVVSPSLTTINQPIRTDVYTGRQYTF